MYFSFLNRLHRYEQAAEKDLQGLANGRSRKKDLAINNLKKDSGNDLLINLFSFS